MSWLESLTDLDGEGVRTSEGHAVAGVVELPLRVRQNGDPVLGLYRDGDGGDLVSVADEDYGTFRTAIKRLRDTASALSEKDSGVSSR